MTRNSAESSGFHGIIKTAPKSACNTRRGLTRSSGTSREGLPAMVPKTCSIADCEQASRARGYCHKHWKRWRKHGDPSVVLVSSKPKYVGCAVVGCETKHHAHGYCSTHATRYKTNGDPLVVGEHYPGRPRLAQPTYGGVHKRLSLEKGKARAHLCVDCGKRAHEWSYDGGCPNELFETLDKSPIAYSTDLSLYSPRCHPCHRGRDASLNRERRANGQWAATKEMK